MNDCTDFEIQSRSWIEAPGTVISADIVQAYAALRESEERFRSLIEFSSDWYWEQDENYRFTLISDSVLQVWSARRKYLGYTRWEIPGALVSPEDWARHRAALDARETFRDFEYEVIGEDARSLYVSISGKPIFDVAGNFKGYRGIGRNITERKLAQERIRFLATHDALTELPNRALFFEHLEQAIARARREQSRVVMFFIDLDGFKTVNDRLGHAIGDLLLGEVARRLQDCVRASDIVCRFGGDEFVALFDHHHSRADSLQVAAKIIEAVGKPYVCLSYALTVAASIGIAAFPDDAQDPQTLVQRSDSAMYRSKSKGGSQASF